jgi:hypothetical protein
MAPNAAGTAGPSDETQLRAFSRLLMHVHAEHLDNREAGIPVLEQLRVRFEGEARATYRPATTSIAILRFLDRDARDGGRHARQPRSRRVQLYSRWFGTIVDVRRCDILPPAKPSVHRHDICCPPALRRTRPCRLSRELRAAGADRFGLGQEICLSHDHPADG